MTIDLKSNNFDLLRIVAATQVLLIHGYWRLDVPRPSWWPLLDAFPGVSIFFVISGFLISASYERSADIKSYARNRIVRIYPGLWCCIATTILVFSFLGTNFLHPSTLLWIPSQLVGVIYTPSFLESFGFGSYNGSLWTIPIELQFYVLLPFLYYLGRNTKDLTVYILVTCLAFVCIAMLASYFVSPLPDLEAETVGKKLFRYSFVPHFYLFLTGVLLQRFKAHELNVVAGKGLLWVVAYLAAWYLLPFKGAFRVALLLLLAITSISLAYTLPGLSRKILRGNDLSYGVYIYHGLLLNVFIELQWRGSGFHIVGLAAASYAAASLSWILVERPFLRKKQRQSVHGQSALIVK